jgi:hypothetical protein
VWENVKPGGTKSKHLAIKNYENVSVKHEISTQWPCRIACFGLTPLSIESLEQGVQNVAR